MKDFQRELNELMRKFNNTEYDLLDDFAVQEMGDEPLDKLLSERGITFEQALSEEKSERERYRADAQKHGLTDLEPPLVWSEIIRLCKEDNSGSCLEILLWLLTGGRFSEKRDDELGDDFAVRRWLGVSGRKAEYAGYINTYKDSIDKFAEILRAAETVKFIARGSSGTDSERVFSLLCGSGFAEDCKNRQVLRDNIADLDGMISAYEFLQPIKPLIYFQTCVKRRSKLLNSTDFSPNLKKLFEYTEYDIFEDNGKNFVQYAVYCELYVRLKALLSDSDAGMCDAGFMYCSNLADWYHSLGAMGYECDIPEGIPFTIEAAVSEMCVSCFDEPSSLDFIDNSEPFEGQQSKYPVLLRKAEKAADAICFDELREFAEDSTGFCEKLFTEEYAASVSARNHSAAWGILIRAVERKFDELLENEIISILYDCIKT